MKPLDEEKKREILQSFEKAVNMPPALLRKWLETEQSKAVGWPKDRGDAESVGHQSGRRILAIKRKKQSNLSDDDYAHMRKVVGYVHRHLAQRPLRDVSETRWRYSLMNWGHDPLMD